MRIVKKSELSEELKKENFTVEVFNGIGLKSNKPYTCLKVINSNGDSFMVFPDDNQYKSVGIVVDHKA